MTVAVRGIRSQGDRVGAFRLYLNPHEPKRYAEQWPFGLLLRSFTDFWSIILPMLGGLVKLGLFGLPDFGEASFGDQVMEDSLRPKPCLKFFQAKSA